MQDMEKTYNPEFEKRIYDMWMKGKFFEAHPNAEKEPFTVMMPPPNITGQLHMGHALDETIQDVIVRFKRMSGYETLWMPGTDHASIATEVKVVEKMRKDEGLSKNDVGRDGFLERAWAWKNQRLRAWLAPQLARHPSHRRRRTYERKRRQVSRYGQTFGKKGYR